VWRHQRRMVRAFDGEEHEQDRRHFEARSRRLENCVLADSELDAVPGGKLLEAAVKGKVFTTVEIHGTA
jgi:hypothetical protein